MGSEFRELSAREKGLVEKLLNAAPQGVAEATLEKLLTPQLPFAFTA